MGLLTFGVAAYCPYDGEGRGSICEPERKSGGYVGQAKVTNRSTAKYKGSEDGKDVQLLWM